jgi:mannose-1-phosphate guanylyltransferase
MKLLPNAIAVLTLGARLNRDKFMQAAGRLRQLSKGQNLVIVGTEEICCLISDRNQNISIDEIQPAHVLEWVHHNTAAFNSEVC